MLKIVSYSIVITGFFASSAILARGGEGEGESRAGRATRGTAGWFVTESGENEIKALLGSGRLKESSVTGLSVRLTSAATSEVILSTSEGQINDTCEMVDHSSRSGTLIKKEVFCGNSPYYAPEIEPSRGSSAWIAVDSMEHAMRAEIAKNPAVEANFVSGESLLAQDGKSATVQLSLADETSISYLCTLFMSSSRGGTVMKPDLRCVAQ